LTCGGASGGVRLVIGDKSDIVAGADWKSEGVSD
jgi:hypothetical protein